MLAALDEMLKLKTVLHTDLLAEVVKPEMWLASVVQHQKEARVPVHSYA